MDPDLDFADFVASRWASLYRLAYLLAASPAGAEDLLQTALEKAYVRWGRISQMEHPEAQIADTLGCAPGTVKSQTSAAKAALRRALAASGVGLEVRDA